MRGTSRRMEGRTYLGKAIQGCLLLFLSPAVPVSLDNTYSGHNHALSFSFKYLTSSHACLDTYTQTIAYSDTCILLQFYSLTRSYCLTCILCIYDYINLDTFLDLGIFVSGKITLFMMLSLLQRSS